jgi:hypothetical protein
MVAPAAGGVVMNPCQLYEEARRKGIRGRSKMSKVQLERAVDHTE